MVAERRTPEETRTCILEVAWDLFRQLGSRTTVADVADKAGMSSANVYRFFPSKQALSEAVCEGLLGEMLMAARAELEKPGAASERIAAMMLTLHRLMRDQMIQEMRAHEVVKMALDENWPPIHAYLEQCVALVAGAIAEGQAACEFGPGDPLELAWLTLGSCILIHDPTMIAQCAEVRPEARPEDTIHFALRALANPNPPPPLAGS